MRFETFSTLPSTQIFLIERIKSGQIDSETCIIAQRQTDGIGSRGNEWSAVERGLYFSFAKALTSLQNDVRVQSMAIFFAFIFMNYLQNLGSKIWLKYPNDLFLGDDKIGGVICSIVENYAVCGIGLNVQSSEFFNVEPEVAELLCGDVEGHLRAYFSTIDTTSWSDVFTAYKAQFHKNKRFSFHYGNQILSLENATLQSDGAIKIGETIIYNAR